MVNLDQSFTQGRNITLSMSFAKNGNELFKTLDWYWFTSGIVIAMKNQILWILSIQLKTCRKTKQKDRKDRKR